MDSSLFERLLSICCTYVGSAITWKGWVWREISVFGGGEPFLAAPSWDPSLYGINPVFWFLEYLPSYIFNHSQKFNLDNSQAVITSDYINSLCMIVFMRLKYHLHLKTVEYELYEMKIQMKQYHYSRSIEESWSCDESHIHQEEVALHQL